MIGNHQFRSKRAAKVAPTANQRMPRHRPSRSNPLAFGRQRPVMIWTTQTAATEVPAQTMRPSNIGDRIQKAGGNAEWPSTKPVIHSVVPATAAQTNIPVATAIQAEIPG
jgi:hypothetical protein